MITTDTIMVKSTFDVHEKSADYRETSKILREKMKCG